MALSWHCDITAFLIFHIHTALAAKTADPAGLSKDSHLVIQVKISYMAGVFGMAFGCTVRRLPAFTWDGFMQRALLFAHLVVISACIYIFDMFHAMCGNGSSIIAMSFLKPKLFSVSS